MTLPLLISVPHAGLVVSEEVRDICILSEEDIIADGDEGAAEVYDIADHVAAFVTTDIARAIVDMNRAEDDIRKDGVVKTHTCWEKPIYSRPLTKSETEALIERYHRPYHARLSALASEDVRLAIDCHTMAAIGPPVGPDTGKKRPMVCLGYGDGTCPEEWIQSLATCFRDQFGDDVTINEPFSGGYITRRHASEMPWVQVELSRDPAIPNNLKRQYILNGLAEWLDRSS